MKQLQLIESKMEGMQCLLGMKGQEREAEEEEDASWNQQRSETN